MEETQKLLQWAKEKNIVLNGISVADIPGRGFGVVAERQIEAGETILIVPTETFMSLRTVPESLRQKLSRVISLHGLLAADLVINKPTELTPWRAGLPTIANFDATIPFMWHETLQALLPKAAKDLLQKQQMRFQREWDLVSKAFPGIPREDYVYAWFLVNTRTFYFESDETIRYTPNDRMALVPVADLFNHAESGCQVSFSSEEYSIVADRAYQPGEEVYISYGAHSNDLLLAEYGFILEDNQSDEVCLDDIISPMLNSSLKAELETRGISDPFTLDADASICRGAQLALSLMCCPQEEWQKITYFEDDSSPELLEKVDAKLIQILLDFANTIRKTMQDISKLQIGQATQRDILKQRWTQIQVIVTQSINNLRSQTSKAYVS